MAQILGFEIKEKESGSAVKQSFSIVASSLICLIFGGVLIKAVSNIDPFSAYWSLLTGAFGSKYAISETLIRAIPLTMMGLATTVCFRAMIWNIGGNGQLYAGAMAATILALYVEFLPPIVLIPLVLISAALAGAIWSAIAGFLRARYGLHEILTTIFMNFIFEIFTTFLLEGVWRDPTWGMNWTKMFDQNTWWPVLIPGTKIHIGLIIAVAAVLFVHYMLFHAPIGYEIRSFGRNPKAAAFKGIRVTRVIMLVTVIHGAIAGLAGAGQVCGINHRLSMHINPGYGFTGILIAQMSRLTPLGVALAALFIGGLINGSYNMEAVNGVPNALIDLIQAVMFISVISAQIIANYEVRRLPKNE